MNDTSSTDAAGYPLEDRQAVYVPDVETPAPTRLAQAAVEETGERTLSGHQIAVQLEDGREFTVRVDNRDFVRWDMTSPRQKWGTAKDVPFLFQTFLAWSAGKRAGHAVGSFESFRDQVIEAKDVPQEDSDTARPTQ